MLQNSRYAFINGFTLKLIAFLSMTCDHIAAALISSKEYPELYKLMRGFGRIAFPIFCFLLVEGFLHTKNVKRYLIRLFIFALISEIPFDLAFKSSPGIYFDHQNVFFTLSLGLLTLCCIKQYYDNPYRHVIIITISCLIAYFLRTDYMFYGIMQICIFYYLRESLLFKSFSVGFLNVYMDQPAGAAALVFTGLYNGKRGPGIKYIFYVYYPLHLLVLYFIKCSSLL